jgi:hypothetical protein
MFSANGQMRVYAAGGDALSNVRTLFSMGLEPRKVAQVNDSWPLSLLFFLPLHNHPKRARTDGQNTSKIFCGPLDRLLERVIFKPDKAHQRSIFH